MTFASHNQLHMHGFSDRVNLLGSSPSTTVSADSLVGSVPTYVSVPSSNPGSRISPEKTNKKKSIALAIQSTLKNTSHKKDLKDL